MPQVLHLPTESKSLPSDKSNMDLRQWLQDDTLDSNTIQHSNTQSRINQDLQETWPGKHNSKLLETPYFLPTCHENPLEWVCTQSCATTPQPPSQASPALLIWLCKPTKVHLITKILFSGGKATGQEMERTWCCCLCLLTRAEFLKALKGRE